MPQAPQQHGMQTAMPQAPQQPTMPNTPQQQAMQTAMPQAPQQPTMQTAMLPLQQEPNGGSVYITSPGQPQHQMDQRGSVYIDQVPGGSGSPPSPTHSQDQQQAATGTDNRTSSNHDEGAQQPKVNIEPARVEVPARGGVSTHQLHNESHKRLAFKIKATNSEHYRASHVYGFIDPGASVSIEVTRLAGPARNDVLLVQLIEVSADDQDPQAPFKLGPPQKELRVQISATD